MDGTGHAGGVGGDDPLRFGFMAAGSWDGGTDDKAFVIMQVGSEGSPERRRADEVYNYIVRPALEAFDVKPYRSDHDPSPGAVTPTMLRELLNARLVIADLTGRNPNVYYELGVSHSFTRPLICIAETADSLPFDAKDERVIQIGLYPESGLPYAQGEKAKASLIESLRIVLADDYVAPSPLRDVAVNRSLDELAPTNPLAAELAALREAVGELSAKSNPPRIVLPQWWVADLGALHGIIERNLHLLSVDEVANLTTPETSKAHDRWVSDVLSRMDDMGTNTMRIPASDPWSTPADNDEPPF